MDHEDFRKHGHQLVDWMADYLDRVSELPVTPNIVPGEITSLLEPSPPERGEPFERLFADFQSIVVPGMTHWNHPGWFAYFPGNNSPPSILAEMLTATLGAQCMSWATSPAATELEQVTMDWLRQMLSLPRGFVGVIQDTASTATLVALLTARDRATGYAASQGGMAEGARLTVYASTQAHSSVLKGVRLAGYGLDQLRLIPVDSAYAMRPDRLAEAVMSDLAAGFRPACVVATVGTTSSTAIDPLPAIADICERHGVWLHLDAAYAGAAAIVPELRPLFGGMERADSLVLNPHKWMLVNFDCSAYYVRDRDALLRSFQISPEYLRTSQDDAVVNYRDWGIQLGRRFRALKLWFVLRSYGVEGLQTVVRTHLTLARELAEWIDRDPDFQLMAPVPFGLVCFRFCPRGVTDEASLTEMNRSLLSRVNASRRVHLTHTELGGRFTIRMVVGQRQTQRSHVEEAWGLIRREAEALAVSR